MIGKAQGHTYKVPLGGQSPNVVLIHQDLALILLIIIVHFMLHNLPLAFPKNTLISYYVWKYLETMARSLHAVRPPRHGIITTTYPLMLPFSRGPRFLIMPCLSDLTYYKENRGQASY